jgi:hypothetical protein
LFGMTAEAGPGACLSTVAVFLLLVAPLVLLFRAIVRLARQAYGFDPQLPDDGPALRVCARCHNSVLEPDFDHCPYCGAALPTA